ncbi:MAG: iron-containing alcohol dehydrogenase [Spirochaetota bacterium]
MIQPNTPFTFPAIRTEILFGNGVISDLPGRIRSMGSSRVLIVTDAGIVRAGVVDTVREVLMNEDISVGVFDDVPQDSGTAVAEAGAEQFRREEAEVVIGLGGGSSLDTAKATAVAVANPHKLPQYGGLNKIEHAPVPMIAIPTTSGTGSEVSYWAAITNDENHVKIGIGGDYVFPRLAVCDPSLTMGLPPFITATTGIDALTHAIESYVNRSYQPISSVLTYRAIELIGCYLVRAVKDGSDSEARYGMMLASTLAGMGMNPTRLGIVHALAMPLGSWELKIAHGTGNAVLLPHVMEFNRSAVPERYADVARGLGVVSGSDSGESAASKAVEAVRRICNEIGIPSGLGELGLTESWIPKVCEVAMKSGNIPANPRDVNQEQLESICRRAL